MRFRGAIFFGAGAPADWICEVPSMDSVLDKVQSVKDTFGGLCDKL